LKTLAVLLLFAIPTLAQVHVTPQAKAIHDSAIVIDTHADTTQFFLDPNFDLAKPPLDLHLDLNKAKQGNLGAEFFSIWVEPTLYPGQYAHRTLQLIDSVYQQARKHPDKMMMAFSVAGPTFPSTVKWWSCWNERTAWSVPGPKARSAWSGCPS